MHKWIVTPINSPTILRNCTNCGNASSFICSNNFRVNANGKNIDVWLIYKCKECDSTLNITIMSRIKPSQIEKSLYESFEKNDHEIAMKYAFDLQILRKNKAIIYYDDIQYRIVSTNINDDNQDDLEIVSKYDLRIRLDKILSEQLNVSRTKIKMLFENGTIQCDDPKVTSRTKLKNNLKLSFKWHIFGSEKCYRLIH